MGSIPAGSTMNNGFLLALATLVGTIIGGGIFGLPYVVSKSGLVPGVFYLVVLGGLVMLLHLFFGEIALRTSEKHRLIGYAELYLGGWAKKLVTVSTVVGMVGALLAYIIIAGDFLGVAFGSIFSGVSNTVFSLIFWAVLSVFILKGIQAISKMELFMNIALFTVIFAIFLFAFPHVETENFVAIDFSHLFLPYGVVLFAFAGWQAIPEIAGLPFANKFRIYRKNTLSAGFARFVMVPNRGTPQEREVLDGRFENHLDTLNPKVAIVVGNCTDLCVMQLAMFVKT